MNIQQQHGIVSTVNIFPYLDTADRCNSRNLIFSQAIEESNCTPLFHSDMFDESLLVFVNYEQAVKFLASLYRSLTSVVESSGEDLGLRTGVCLGNYFLHQDQIYGEAVNLATKLSCTSRKNEMLVCGIDKQVLNRLLDREGDLVSYVRDLDENCVSIGLLNVETTALQFDNKEFQIEQSNQLLVFETMRNRKIHIGRDDDLDIVIPGDHISRNHATITLNYDKVFVEDHSSNGTYIYTDNREIFLSNDSITLSGLEGQLSFGRNKASNIGLPGIIEFSMNEQMKPAA